MTSKKPQTLRKPAGAKGDLAARVAEQVQILSVRLLDTSAEQKAAGADDPGKVQTGFEVEATFDQAASRLRVLPRFTLAAVRPDGAADEWFLRIQAKFELVYDVDSSRGLSDAHYGAFAESNGVFNVWPYWREYVQSTTVRMGFPPLTLPVFRLGITRVKTPSRDSDRSADREDGTDSTAD